MKHDWQEWIDRLGNNDVSEQELRDFQKAIQESPEHMDEYMDALLVDASLEMKDGLPSFLWYDAETVVRDGKSYEVTVTLEADD